MSLLRTRRAREFARLQAAGWTVVTVSPWDRLRTARRARADWAPERSPAPRRRRPGWSA
jgi:hypothetical protein